MGSVFQGWTWCLLIVAWSSACETTTPDSRPNIVLIMADDLGYGELGCYGNTAINTPNLDRLAERGLRFTDFHSNGAVCTPTRAALLTGRYQQRAGLEGVIYVRGETRQMGMDTAEVTLAEVLRDHGYVTGIVGKWHLGYRAEFNPVHQGFDEFKGYVSGNVDYHSHYDNAGIYDWYDGLDSLYQEGYVTDLITDNAIDFIERHQDEPFFLYVSHEAPHVPFQGRSDSAFRFPDREFTYLGPATDRKGKLREMVEVMDEGIGKLMHKLEAIGLEEETMVIFLSDNGGRGDVANNGPLRGHKGQLWEGGHRVPAMVYYPGKIEGGTSGDLAMSMDLFPTVLSMCGIEEIGVKLDGMDLSPVLLQNQTLTERPVFWRYRGQQAVRWGDYKLMLTAEDTTLFDLGKDLAEQIDVSQMYPGVLQDLTDRLQNWQKEIDRTVQLTN